MMPGGSIVHHQKTPRFSAGTQIRACKIRNRCQFTAPKQSIGECGSEEACRQKGQLVERKILPAQGSGPFRRFPGLAGFRRELSKRLARSSSRGTLSAKDGVPSMAR